MTEFALPPSPIIKVPFDFHLLKKHLHTVSMYEETVMLVILQKQAPLENKNLDTFDLLFAVTVHDSSVCQTCTCLGLYVNVFRINVNC